jgi:hypothetical protein
MKDFDYENLFVYMSLIFAICIFIVLLYGCAFANPKGNSLIIENFEGETDIKTQVLSLLKELEEKDTTSTENKTSIKDIREKINNNNISVNDLKNTISLLKEMASDSKKEDKKEDKKEEKKDDKKTSEKFSDDDDEDEAKDNK